MNATAIVERIAFSSGFEPNMAVLNPCERYLRAFIVLMYDRDAQGEDERAMHAARTIARELNCAGYTAYRLGIQTMDTYRPTDLGYVEVLRGLKQYFDPGGVLAPGRYDLFDELSEGG